MVSFTGSTRAGKLIQKNAWTKRCSKQRHTSSRVPLKAYNHIQINSITKHTDILRLHHSIPITAQFLNSSHKEKSPNQY